MVNSPVADLVVPGIDAMKEAGKLLENLPKLRGKADLTEKRRILITMLEAVYVECKEEKRIVAIKAKPAFKPLFQIALTRQGSEVTIIHENTPSHNNATETNPCFWWRRGRVELPLTHGIEVLLAA